MRYWLKGCPRCHGDLREEKDHYGLFICCLQCGYMPGEREEVVLRSRVEGRPARLVMGASAA